MRGCIRAVQRLGYEYTRNSRIVGRVVFYAVRVLSKESRRVVISRTSCYCLKSHVFELREELWEVLELFEIYRMAVRCDHVPIWQL
jgi:hypothetical protein